MMFRYILEKYGQLLSNSEYSILLHHINYPLFGCFRPYRPPQKQPTGGYGQSSDNLHNKINLGEIGQVNGVPIFQYDMNSSDKPWKQPGADITDYFNYGFTEETWRVYCEKQKKMRSEIQLLNHSLSQSDNVKMIPTIGQQSKCINRIIEGI
jgi:hypothetical protein